jgi:hypothetical protein
VDSITSSGGGVTCKPFERYFNRNIWRTYRKKDNMIIIVLSKDR